MDLSEIGPGGINAIFLDDCRTPQPTHGVAWHIVRSVAEFVAHIEAHGVPAFISFDHDLGHHVPAFASPEAEAAALAEPLIETEQGWFRPCVVLEPSGMDAAKWLVDYCLATNQRLNRFSVHSANPAGAENILGLLNNFMRHCGQVPTGYRTIW